MAKPQPRISTGSMNFALLRRSGCYYVDKTMYLRELIEPVQDPLLLTRPRRFGKTLTQTTLRSFLQLNFEHPGMPNADAELFSDLFVSSDRQLCQAFQGQFPVIFLTLKDVQQSTFTDACGKLCAKITELYTAFRFLADDPRLSPGQREDFADLLRLTRISDRDGLRHQLLTSSLLLLARCLYTVYQRPAYILIDEYDVPLLWAAHYSGTEEHSYYEKLRALLFGMLGEVLKTEDTAVRRCIMTGCLRLSPPGSISGVNNLLELGMDDQRCAGLMGFTQEEADELLSACGLSERREEVRSWYDGYLCGATRLYNPWSLIHYCAFIRANPAAAPRNFWIMTSSDDFRRRFIGELSAGSMTIMQQLLDGQAVSLSLREQLGYPDLAEHEHDDRSFFTLLYYSGYLTRAQPDSRDDEGVVRYVIPNCEVLDCFRVRIHDYFTAQAAYNPRLQALIGALLQGHGSEAEDGLNWLYTHYLDMQAAAGRLQRRRSRDASVPDEPAPAEQMRQGRRSERELGYQALTQGVLTAFDQSVITALRMEHTLGTGRVDISFAGRGAAATTACLLEFKIAADSSDEALDAAAELGLAQTRDNGCAAALLERNPALEIVYSCGIGCRQKSCRVRMEEVRRAPD